MTPISLHVEEISALRLFYGIGDGQELGQRQLKPWQQGRRIGFLLGNDYLCHLVGPDKLGRRRNWG